MRTRLLGSFLAHSLALVIGSAPQAARASDQSPVKIPPSDGKAMFAHYCTPCHGADGKGHGPVVAAHGVAAIDLTILSKANNGKFPQEEVVDVLQHGARVPSHTAVEMPVWGPILGKISKKDPNDRVLRVTSLTHYVESIQEK